MRNAEFDREKVLRAAMNAFMDKGYANTSMQALKAATGLHPGSIYCAFENKRGLLLAAIAQYRQDRSAEFQRFFQDEAKNGVLNSLKSYLEHTVNECLSCDTTKACLLTKALNELAEQDDEIQEILIGNINQWQASIADVFQRAISAGEIESSRDATQLARFFVMGIYGLRTYAHTHPEAGILKQLAAQLFENIQH
jgi:AcrR family transcriptional regulator